MRIRPISVASSGLCLLAAATAAAQPISPEKLSAFLDLSANAYSAQVICPGGLDPDPTETIAAIGVTSGVRPEDMAPGGRHFEAFKAAVVKVGTDIKGKSPDESCALLASRYPTWIRPRGR